MIPDQGIAGFVKTDGDAAERKLVINTIEALVDIKRFLKRWDKMRLEHV